MKKFLSTIWKSLRGFRITKTYLKALVKAQQKYTWDLVVSIVEFFAHAVWLVIYSVIYLIAWLLGKVSNEKLNDN